VIAMYSKSGSKGVNHASVTNSSNICVLSYLVLQVYEHHTGNQFTSITGSTLLLQTKWFVLIPFIQIMLVL
ncbi:hypothetical protein F5146DRAFT_906622, partial [Armillaria mellea]